VKPTIARGFDYKALNWVANGRASGEIEIPLAPQVAAVGEDAGPIAA
jgi:hypothetical protein